MATAKYQLHVGLEIHTALNTATKMFCGCLNDPYKSPPNTNICPVCYGLPGALPTVNLEAIKKALLLGRALKAQLPQQTWFARKHYFYPDLPKSYQISQYDNPIIGPAIVDVKGQKYKLIRIHLEEDAAKLIHLKSNHTAVDYNRAGVPLLEMVTEPVFRTANEVKEFAKEWQLILRELNISNADMEKGEMRCEANISVKSQIPNPKSRANSKFEIPQIKLGTKVEVKNINSFRSLEKAIEYEFNRQTKLLDGGGQVTQETRGWDDLKQKTVSMRIKETASDYRYFQEPDLPIINLSSIKTPVLELPEAKRLLMLKFGLSRQEADQIVTLQAVPWAIEWRKFLGKNYSIYFSKGVRLYLSAPKINQLTMIDFLTLLKNQEVHGWPKVTMLKLVDELIQGRSIHEVIKFGKINLDHIIDEVMKSSSRQLELYRQGQTSIINSLVGQVMKQTDGMVDARKVKEMFEIKLKNDRIKP